MSLKRINEGEGYYNKRVQIDPQVDKITKVQALVRGFLARRPYLPSHLYPQYKVQCKHENLKLHKQAESGKTTVYLPAAMPDIVLKRSKEDSAYRFEGMQTMRSILSEQKATHLIIPRARVLKSDGFIVEERLPINANSYHNMGLYLSDPKLFDQAVSEMTRLFSKVVLTDLVSYQINHLSNLEGIENKVRHDNLPLFVVEKEGKKEGVIGFIDLEHTSFSPTKKVGDPYHIATLVRIFPLHLSLIKQEAAKLQLTYDEGLVQKAALDGCTYLKLGYKDHLEWIKNHPPEVSIKEDRIPELSKVVEDELLKLDKGTNDFYKKAGISGDPPKEFLKGNEKELALQITHSFIKAIPKAIKQDYLESLTKFENKTINNSDWVSIRSPVLDRYELYQGVKPLLEKAGVHFLVCRGIAEQLLFVFMKELQRGGECFVFDPGYYTQGHKKCWIRY